jgi:hypothetical protein
MKEAQEMSQYLFMTEEKHKNIISYSVSYT